MPPGAALMLINVRVIAKASKTAVKKEGDNYKLYLTKPAQDGLANIQLLETLSDYFNVKRYQVKIIKGHTSRNKIVEIDV